MKVCGKDIKVQGRLIRTAKLAAEFYEFLEDPEAALENLRRSELHIDLFTFIPRLSERSCKYPYAMEWDNLAVIPVSTFDEWWTKQIDGKTRNMVRRADKKGVVVKEVQFDDALVRSISAIYDECPMRQGRRFWHYKKDLESVRRENGTFLDRSVFLGAYVGDDMIGFAKLVHDESHQQAGLMQIISMVQHRDKAPTNALIAAAVRSCAGRGIFYLAYSNFPNGKGEQHPLSDFKKNNGFQRIDLPRYYVPVTHAGAIAFRLGLHKRFTDLLPRSLAATLRKVRNRWNNRKLQPVAHS